MGAFPDKQAIDRRMNAIAGDREHGASALARRCLDIAADSALYYPAPDTPALTAILTAQAQDMSAARPSMAPIHNLLSRWQRELQGLNGLDLETARRRAADAARAVAKVSQAACRQAALHAQSLIGERQCVITHSLSSTLLQAFTALQGRGASLIVTESRPLCEGRNLALQLAGMGLPTTLITDAQLGLFVEKADLAMVGADSVLEDGTVVNKVGTYLLALAARENSIPFYVCCESFKQRDSSMPPFEPEEMSPDELNLGELPKVEIRNIYFDLTPPELITARVSEEGVSRCRLNKQC